MHCKLSLATAIATCVAGAVSADSADSADTKFQLYAYGKVAKSGVQLFYGDGMAYVGGTPSYVKESANITLAMPLGGDTFVANPANTAEASTLDWSPKPTMYIDMTEGAATAVGFTKDNTTLPSNATTLGFGLYGGWAYHKKQAANAKDLEMKFVATPTNETGIYLVKWNAASTRASDEIPISLRTQAPIVLD